ncbi:hypothetical protein CLV56_0297 [Mumia flava]|uniref:Enoyl reductase n=1 Tax=Mumia flava TaxID=1348852 RepID=A0A0B2AY15_9ACTN|nr:hypothetical protein [Mumia flava]PJJ56093.1 hypothetical protein CLV56_0297 [Mumia flava]
MLNRLAAVLAGALLALASTVGLTLATATSASGAEPTCEPPAQAQWNGFSYTCVVPGGGGGGGNDGGGDNGGGDGGGPSEPTCDLDSADLTGWENWNPTALYCVGTQPCFTGEILPPIALPEGEKPEEDSKALAQVCFNGFSWEAGPSYWSDDAEPQPPSLAEQAQEAIGNIDLGNPEIKTSPQTRSLVNLDTWYWLDGVPEEVTGSSAFGLVAIATFQSMSVDPGDGSGGMSCPWTTSRAQAESDCTYTYHRASVRGSANVDGKRAYPVRITTVYDLRFEVNGVPVEGEIPGAPPTLDGPPATAALVVDEAQSLVTRID